MERWGGAEAGWGPFLSLSLQMPADTPGCTLSGTEAAQWTCGISTIEQQIRSLYLSWANVCLLSNCFTC